MRLLTFTPPDSIQPRVGALIYEDTVLDLRAADPALPTTMIELIGAGEASLERVKEAIKQLSRVTYALAEVKLCPPVINPPTFRDFYAFEQHVATANANRGQQVPAEWYQFPVFYFSNPNALYAHAQAVPRPRDTQALDYELEIAAIIGKCGRDIPPERADKHIFGYTLLNDWSARDVQRKEMRVGLGPAKGKDFATSLGPWIDTPDELEDRKTDRRCTYDLQMIARVNGVERSRGNWKDIYYTFAEMIARASCEVTLLPGEIIGSGTVGTGCLLELTKGQGPYLQPGDVVELEIERLGMLRNVIV